MHRSALHEVHERMGARFTEFAGWEMPLQYGGVVDEHRTVRSLAGLFDVSHLGRLEVTGGDCFRLLNNCLTAEIADLMPGLAVYTFFCNEEGGILDDVIVYHRKDNNYLVCTNAVNREKIALWLQEKGQGMNVEIKDVTFSTAQIALQGPSARAVLAKVCDRDCDLLAWRNFSVRLVAEKETMVARTGYTGEVGFELIMPAGDAMTVWDAIVAAGSDMGIKPAGLGARDTLRLEMGYPLYGHDINESTTPMEAGLDRFVNLEKGAFEGKSALAVQRAIGVKRRLCGLILKERGVPREGFKVYRETAGEPVEAGQVTSGNFSPSLEKGIALAYLKVEESKPGTSLIMDIRDKRIGAQVVELPFYRKRK